MAGRAHAAAGSPRALPAAGGFSLRPWGAGGRAWAASRSPGFLPLLSLFHFSFRLYASLSVSLFHFQISISFSPLFSSLTGLSFPLFPPPYLLPQVAVSLSPTSCSSHNSYLSLEENREGGLYTLEIAFKLKTTTTISTSRSCRPLPVVGHGNVPA